MWWGGKDADVVAMLEEYCDLFYGPAGPKMKAFFDYCEANYQAMDDELEPVLAALAMFDEARATVEPDSVYAKRLALIDQRGSRWVRPETNRAFVTRRRQIGRRPQRQAA